MQFLDASLLPHHPLILIIGKVDILYLTACPNFVIWSEFIFVIPK